MTKSIIKSKRALSPVIATVILVSVTIVVAVSVAYWMGTIAGGYTAFEQVELPTAYSEYDETLYSATGGWKVHIELKNTGSADATINNIFLNAKPLKDYNSSPTANDNVTLYSDGTVEPDLSDIAIRVTKGASATLRIEIKGAGAVEGCTSGTRIDLKLHSAAGRDYPVSVKLP